MHQTYHFIQFLHQTACSKRVTLTLIHPEIAVIGAASCWQIVHGTAFHEIEIGQKQAMGELMPYALPEAYHTHARLMGIS